MSSHVVLPVLIAFAVSLVLGPVVIPFLRKLKMKQTERVDGVQSHLKKAGTPTMGGIIILIAVIVTSLCYVRDYPRIIPILFLTVAFGLIGFLDDYLKDATGAKGREVLSEEDVYHEYVMTALRTIGGVKKSKLSGFSESLQQEFRLRVVHEMEAGNLVEKEDAYVVAEDRRLLTDLIAGTFF